MTGALHRSLNQKLANPVVVEGRRPADEIVKTLTPTQRQRDTGEDIYALSLLSLPLFFSLKTAFEDKGTSRLILRRGCGRRQLV